MDLPWRQTIHNITVLLHSYDFSNNSRKFLKNCKQTLINKQVYHGYLKRCFRRMHTIQQLQCFCVRAFFLGLLRQKQSTFIKIAAYIRVWQLLIMVLKQTDLWSIRHLVSEHSHNSNFTLKGKERKRIYIAPFIYYVYLKALRHKSHSFTRKYTMPAFPSYAFTRWLHL